MSAASQPRILAKASGVVVALDGSTVVIVDRRLGGLATTVFVLAVLAFITGSMGIVFGVDAVASDDGNRVVAAVLIGVAVVAGAFLIAALRAVAARRRRPLSDYQ